METISSTNINFRCLSCPALLGHVRVISPFSFFSLTCSPLACIVIFFVSHSRSKFLTQFRYLFPPPPHPDLRTGPSIVVRGWCVRQRSVYVCSALIWT